MFIFVLATAVAADSTPPELAAVFKEAQVRSTCGLGADSEVHVDIDAKGRLDVASVVGGDEKAAKCVGKALKKSRLPKHASSSLVWHPAKQAGPQGGLPGATPLKNAPVILGAMARKQVDAQFTAAGDDLAKCRDTAPSALGKVVFKFQIAKSGALDSYVVKKSTLAQPEIEACMLERVGEMSFPPVEGGGIAIVSHTVEFDQPR